MKTIAEVSYEAAMMAYHGYVFSVLGCSFILWGISVEVSRVFVQKSRNFAALKRMTLTNLYLNNLM